MNQKLPRRTILLGATLGALPLAAGAAPPKPIQEKLDIQFESEGAVLNTPQMQVKISGQGSAFHGVIAYFVMPDRTRLPFFAWSGGALSVFTMPVSRAGLQLVLEGHESIPVTLRPAAGFYEIRLGSSDTPPLRIELAAV